jgi:hypothetical protein
MALSLARFRGLAPTNARSAQAGDIVLAVNDVEIHSAGEFRRELEKVPVGSEVRLRLERGDTRSLQDKDVREVFGVLNDRAGLGYQSGEKIGGGAVETVSIRAGSYAEWAPPVGWLHPRQERILLNESIQASSGPTKLERFVESHLNQQGIGDHVDRLNRHLASTVERFSGANMLSSVVYAYRRPMRLAELQSSITTPLARIVDGRKDPWDVARLILAEAAKNLDISWSAQSGGEIDLSNPSQAIQATAQRIQLAHTQLELAFRDFDALRRSELAATLPAMLPPSNQFNFSVWHDKASIRSFQASMSLHFANLFAAADEVTGWKAAGAPPTNGRPPVTLPNKLAGAVRGDVLAVEQIADRWYVYGGSGRNEYDLSRIDAVIDAGGDDLYRYPRNERPKVQLVVDWAGNDTYVGANGVPGPGSALLGVSVVIDHQGNDRYEGGSRSCGSAVMGIGLVVDHTGTDTYRGQSWSLGAGYYGFGGIVDLNQRGVLGWGPTSTSPKHTVRPLGDRADSA